LAKELPPKRVREYAPVLVAERQHSPQMRGPTCEETPVAIPLARPSAWFQVNGSLRIPLKIRRTRPAWPPPVWSWVARGETRALQCCCWISSAPCAASSRAIRWGLAASCASRK